MKESQEESGYSDFLLQTDDGSARALRGIDTDTLVGMISTSTALRAGAILVYVTIYPSEMILLQFPPCTGSGHGSHSVHILRSISNFYLTDGAFQGPDDAGGHIPLVIFSMSKDIMHESIRTVYSGIEESCTDLKVSLKRS